ncbi:MAG: hypothetical protein MRY78_16520 [Saprospiraceae bacterium]|nr:hypothetical protein [Saprospiraceae bacterium]
MQTTVYSLKQWLPQSNLAKAKWHLPTVLFWGLLLLSMPAMAFSVSTATTTTTPTIYLGENPDAPTPCSCLNNATNLTNGQFKTTISIAADTAQVWTITQATGLYDINNPAPPDPLIAITAGKIIPAVDSVPGLYQLPIIHIDAIGFSITVENQYGQQLHTEATCFYPNPAIANLDQNLCITSAPLSLSANMDGIQGSGIFQLGSDTITQFIPNDLGPGNYDLSYTFDAGEAGLDDPQNPGCITTIQETIQVHDVPFIAVVNQLTLAMNNQCEIEIDPSLMLVGNYACPDDFHVEVLTPNGQAIGNVITNEYINQTLTVLIESEAGDYSGIGHITPVDYLAPEISCPPTTSTAQRPVLVQFFEDTLSTTDAQLNTDYATCFQHEVAEESGMHYYDLKTFEVDQDDIYTFEFEGNFRQGAAFLYKGISDLSAGPCQSIIAERRERNSGRGYLTEQDTLYAITLSLKKDTEYALLTTAYEANATGSYRWAVYAEHGGQIKDLPSIPGILIRDLICADLDSMQNNDQLLSLTGNPMVSDNCMETPLLVFEDQLMSNGECGVTVMNREFTATDQSGNSKACTQTILFRQPTIEDVLLPPLSTTIECDDLQQWDEDGNPHPDMTGYPMVQTALGVYSLKTDVCNLAASYFDNPGANTCESGYKILRVWSVFDWCDPTTNLIHNQQIRVGDFTPPMVECLVVEDDFGEITDTLRISTTPFDCTASFELPMPDVSDNCSSTAIHSEVITDVEVLVYNQWGFVTDTLIEQEVLATVTSDDVSRMVNNIPLGSHRIRYTVTDGCGNVNTLECSFVVEDQVAPTAICSDDITISIGGDGEVMIDASQLNDGSLDNCSFSHVEVRRQSSGCSPNNDWGNQIPLNCCDVNQEVLVNVRAIDEVGNINNCQVKVFVQDQLPPTCTPPPAVSIRCNDIPESTDLHFLTDLQSLFGTPTTADNCMSDWQEFAAEVDLDDCGTGTITRSFHAVDSYGNTSQNSCVQQIEITIENDYSIKFPRDISLSCDQEMNFEPEVHIRACDLIAVNYQDITYPSVGNERYRIFRTYSIINWCEYDGVADAAIISRDEDCDEQAGEEDVWLNRLPNMAYIDADDDPMNQLPTAASKGYQCDGTTNPVGYWRAIPSIGYWQYTQVIKIYDDTAPTLSFDTPEPVCTDESPCEGQISLEVAFDESCTPEEVTAQLWLAEESTPDQWLDITNEAIQSIQNNSIQIDGYFPIGQHQLRLIANDGFGNKSTIYIPIEVIDCSVPQPECYTDLVFEIQPHLTETDLDGDGEPDYGVFEIFAQDLVDVTPNGCDANLHYAIHELGRPVNLSQQSLLFTCADTNQIDVEIHIWDEAFNPYSLQLDGTLGGPNIDRCFAQIELIDPEDICNPILTTSISGRIKTIEGQGLADVQLTLDGPETADVSTNSLGGYAFEAVLMEEDYVLTPHLDDNPKNGISTFDLILVTKHILGVAPLDSPYKIIAADVDRSGSVSIIDLINIRKMILSILSEFPNNTSWRFVDASYEFPQSTNPWQEVFPEQLSISQLSAENLEADFVAIKVGDVNLDAFTSFQEEQVDNRNQQEPATILAEARAIEPGQRYEFSFSLPEASELQGFQWTMQSTDIDVQMEGITAQTMLEEHFNLAYLPQGYFSASWNQNEAMDSLPLFRLQLKAPSAQAAFDALALSNRLTQTEAYDLSGNVLPVRLQRKALPKAEILQLRNYPNPFLASTMLEFELPESGQVSLQIRDQFGQTVWRKEQYFDAGTHRIPIDQLATYPAGLFYAMLSQNGMQVVQKMIKL